VRVCARARVCVCRPICKVGGSHIYFPLPLQLPLRLILMLFNNAVFTVGDVQSWAVNVKLCEESVVTRLKVL
jgi:hypothetical protein